MLKTHIQKVGAANGVNPRSRKPSTLSEIVQESYKLSYKAKSMKDKSLIKLTESHLENIKNNPTNLKTLTEDTDVLKGLVKVGKDQKIKDLEEVDITKKKRKRSVDSCMKPMMKESWQRKRDSISKSLEPFRENSKNKVFYNELSKFNTKLSEGKKITMNEAIDLYKASNSCLTHLTVELDKNPAFRSAYRECTSLLSRDNRKLLESIQNNKVPSRSLLESFAVFTNILLECDAPEDLDKEKYNEDADMEELKDKDVINEDADMTELDDRDVIDESCEEDEELDESEESVVDLTDEEIEVLRSILSKITGPNESIDTIEDEEEIEDLEEEDEEPVEDEFDTIPDEDLCEEDDFDDEIYDDEEDFEDDLEEEDDLDDEEFNDDLDEDADMTELDDRDVINEEDEIDDEDDLEDDLDEEDETDMEDEDDVPLSESAKLRIKKCF